MGERKEEAAKLLVDTLAGSMNRDKGRKGRKRKQKEGKGCDEGREDFGWLFCEQQRIGCHREDTHYLPTTHPLGL
jgi:hypothetical protein